MKTLLNLPEFNVVLFAVLLNLPWEFLQVPFFRDMPGLAHWDGIRRCATATLGDGILILTAYWATAASARSRRSVLQPTRRHLMTLVGVGLAITVLIERLATTMRWPQGGWNYAELMPVAPILNVGLTPLLQWLVLPPLTLWLVRRQLT